MESAVARPGLDIVQRLLDAANAHDLDALVACFEEGVRSDTPAHPSRSFVGNEQVRRTWAAMFDAVPDIRLTLVGAAGDADTAWCELAFDGMRRDGAPHHMRGVVIFGMGDDGIGTVRFYMEPLVDDGLGPDQAVRRSLTAPASAPATGQQPGAER